MRLIGAGGQGTRLKLAAAALMLYGVVGVVVQLRLFPTTLEGVQGWLRPLLPTGAAPSGWFDPVQAFFDTLPWLPWAAWLGGTVLLALGHRSQPVVSSVGQARVSGLKVGLPLVLLLLMVLGAYARMVELWPPGYGISQRPYDDEGVYAGTSQLFLQGVLPYRDYFFAHPPVAAVAYAPAMGYRFTEWGSPTSFMNARYLSVAYSLITLVLLFFAGVRLTGLWGGAAVGLLWALDGRVVEINRKVMLEGPMVMLSAAALLVYLWVRPSLSGANPEQSSRRTLLLLTGAGVFAALSALTKIAGLACLFAILVDIVWLRLARRRASEEQPSPPSLWVQLGAVLGGAVAAALVALVPFMLAASSQIVRQVFFFQLLRPSDGLSDVPARIADLSSSLTNPLTLVIAALGFVAISVSTWLSGSTGAWRLVVLWTFFSLLLFTYSRSFYGHYYIQLAAPLCLLGAGLAGFKVQGSRPKVGPARSNLEPSTSHASRFTFPAAAIILLLLAPLLLVQWRAVAGERGDHDRIFEIVGRYVSDAVPPGTPVLTTDEQFNFLAARPPSRNSTGYLIDSYGHMISIGLGLMTRDLGDLWSAAARGEHSGDVYAVIQRPAPQADMVDRAALVDLVVIHDKGFSRLTPETVAAITRQHPVAEEQARYTIYRR